MNIFCRYFWDSPYYRITWLTNVYAFSRRSLGKAPWGRGYLLRRSKARLAIYDTPFKATLIMCVFSVSLGNSGHPFAWNDIYVPFCWHCHSYRLVYGRSIKKGKEVFVRRWSGAILCLGWEMKATNYHSSMVKLQGTRLCSLTRLSQLIQKQYQTCQNTTLLSHWDQPYFQHSCCVSWVFSCSFGRKPFYVGLVYNLFQPDPDFVEMV